ncbi:MAG TPA: lamin tail domain-containing protein, partial [Bacteroidota bacterium]|nr:lamin tail domain-containing protein [Bacteroidota bacterium]
SSSVDSSGSTPGLVNSIARLDYDLALTTISVSMRTVGIGTVPVISSTVQNVGRNAVATYQTVITYTHREGIAVAPSDTVAILPHPSPLAPGDSSKTDFIWSFAPAGETLIHVSIKGSHDDRPRNDTLSAYFSLSYTSPSLVINEIMFDPLAGQCEWVELYHRGAVPIDLLRWTVSDRPTPSGSVNRWTLSSQSLIARPGDFVVLAGDSSILSLYSWLRQTPPNVRLVIVNRPDGLGFNNDGDAVVLRDLTSLTVDSVAYLPSWHNPQFTTTNGRSLERINPNGQSNDPRNWSTAAGVLGGSPGKVNSAFTPPAASTSASLTFSPNPFSPDGDGFEDFCNIHFKLSSSASLVRIRLYDIKGRLERTLVQSDVYGPQGDVVWNGLDDAGIRVRIGTHVVLLEAVDRYSGAVTRLKGVIVVATKF